MGRAGSNGEAPEPSVGAETRLLLGTANDWFASALRSMLEPEGYELQRFRGAEPILSRLSRSAPDLVILDEDLPGVDPAELVRTLTDGPLPRHVPLLFHVDGAGSAGTDVEVLRAGAWGLLEEPIRPTRLAAVLERCLRLGGELLERAGDRRYVDPETDVLTLTGLMRIVPAVSNLARRRGEPLTFTAVGPTVPGAGPVLERQRRGTADLCRRSLRKSDFVGWLQEGSDVAIVAYGTSRSGAEGLARRLNVLAEESEGGEFRYTLSAGILQTDPSPPEIVRRGGNGRSPETESKLETLHALAAAQGALREARGAGGGIRHADGS